MMTKMALINIHYDLLSDCVDGYMPELSVIGKRRRGPTLK